MLLFDSLFLFAQVLGVMLLATLCFGFGVMLKL